MTPTPDFVQSPRLRGGRPAVARLMWAVIAVLSVGVYIYFLPAYYHQQFDLAQGTDVACALTQLGLSPGFYATTLTARDATITCVFVLVGLALVWRRGDRRMALLASLMLITMGVFMPRVLQAPLPQPLWEFLAGLVAYLGRVVFIVFLYVFPDGHFHPRWTKRWVVLWAVVIFIMVLLAPSLPFPIDQLNVFQRLAEIIWLGGGLAAQIFRYRHVSGPVERQQTKWVVFGFAILIVPGIMALNLSKVLLMASFQPDLAEVYYNLAAISVFGVIPSLMIPLTIGFSVMRYRLWDLDDIVNRTILYVTLTGLLGTALFGSIVVLQSGFRTLTGQDSVLAAVISTLVIAALARPLARRLQDLIDRTFYRARVDTRQAVREFSGELRTMVDLSQLADALVDRVTRLLSVSRAALYLRDENGEFHLAKAQNLSVKEAETLPLDNRTLDQLQCDRAVSLPDGNTFSLLLPLTISQVTGHELLGILALGPYRSGQGYSSEDRDLLMSLASRAGIVIYVAQLTWAVRESEERFRSLVETTSDWIWEIDQNGVYTYASPAVKTILGYEPEELIGKTPFDLMPSDEAEGVSTTFWDIVAARKPFEQLENVNVHKDGRRIVLETSGTPILAADGELLGYRGIDRDITERKWAERQRETLIAELEAKNAELERFTYTVSHDLKSPLVTITGFLGFLEEDAAKGDLDRLQRDIQHIQEATTTMQRLLGELLELSRVGRLMNSPQEVAFGDVAQEAIARLSGQIDARQVQVNIASDLPTVYGDRLRLAEVLQNLLENAVKFLGDQPEPRIDIGAQQHGDEVVFYVADNGIGIAPRYQEKIFGLFERLDATVEGTGVGLALVKRIIEVHGGRIWVESDGHGHGSTFYFTLGQIQETP